MKKVSETIYQIYKRAAVLVIAVACTALYACGDKASNDNDSTEANATSEQDTFNIRTDEGAGFSMDTSATPAEGVDTGSDSTTSTSEPRRQFPTQEKEENKKANEALSPEKAKGQGTGNQ
jgi:hypothetical protein